MTRYGDVVKLQGAPNDVCTTEGAYTTRLYGSPVMPSKGTMPRVCERCGVGFFAHPSTVKKGEGKFCSRECGRTRPLDPEQRFWSKVDRNGPIPDYAPHLGQCWLWTANRWSDGYGVFHIKKDGRKTTIGAHIWSYRSSIGPFTDGLTLDHLCRVRHCVRPSHLEPVSSRENILRGTSWSAINARLTNCRRGHPFDDANTYVDGTSRVCRECRRLAARRRYAERKTEVSRCTEL